MPEMNGPQPQRAARRICGQVIQAGTAPGQKHLVPLIQHTHRHGASKSRRQAAPAQATGVTIAGCQRGKHTGVGHACPRVPVIGRLGMLYERTYSDLLTGASSTAGSPHDAFAMRMKIFRDGLLGVVNDGALVGASIVINNRENANAAYVAKKGFLAQPLDYFHSGKTLLIAKIPRRSVNSYSANRVFLKLNIRLTQRIRFTIFKGEINACSAA